MKGISRGNDFNNNMKRRSNYIRSIKCKSYGSLNLDAITLDTESCYVYLSLDSAYYSSELVGSEVSSSGQRLLRFSSERQSILVINFTIVDTILKARLVLQKPKLALDVSQNSFKWYPLSCIPKTNLRALQFTGSDISSIIEFFTYNFGFQSSSGKNLLCSHIPFKLGLVIFVVFGSYFHFRYRTPLLGKELCNLLNTNIYIKHSIAREPGLCKTPVSTKLNTASCEKNGLLCIVRRIQELVRKKPKILGTEESTPKVLSCDNSQKMCTPISEFDTIFSDFLRNCEQRRAKKAALSSQKSEICDINIAKYDSYSHSYNPQTPYANEIKFTEEYTPDFSENFSTYEENTCKKYNVERFNLQQRKLSISPTRDSSAECFFSSNDEPLSSRYRYRLRDLPSRRKDETGSRCNQSTKDWNKNLNVSAHNFNIDSPSKKRKILGDIGNISMSMKSFKTIDDFSAAEISRRTHENTRKNSKYICKVEKKLLFSSKKRPTSPNAKSRSRVAAIERNRRKALQSTHGWVLGPGDNEEWKPQNKKSSYRKQVRWHKNLETDPSHSHRKNDVEKQHQKISSAIREVSSPIRRPIAYKIDHQVGWNGEFGLTYQRNKREFCACDLCAKDYIPKR